MSWLPDRDKLDPAQTSAIDFVVAQEGNFFVKGEAGTGKSVVLAHIAKKYKADNPKAKVAVLTYTNAFAAYLAEAVKGSGVEVQTILKFKLEDKRKCDLLLIDEAQDIKLDWVKKLEGLAKRFAFAGDFTQMIYGETDRVITEDELVKKFDVKMSIPLTKDYRLPNSQRVLLSKVYQGGRTFVSKIANKALNDRVVLYHAKDWQDEVTHADSYLREKAHKRRPAALLLNTNLKIRRFFEAVVPGLKEEFDGRGEIQFLSGVNAYLISQGSVYRYLGRGFGDILESNERPLVYVMTWHGSKGLDFETVAIPNLGAKGASVKANTFYVAMTRSRKYLMMSYWGAAGSQTESARTSEVVDFFSKVKDDYRQAGLFD